MIARRNENCPFCGKPVRFVTVGPNYRFVCDNCEMTYEQRNSEDKEDTIEQWNRRTGKGTLLMVDDGEYISLQGIHPDGVPMDLVNNMKKSGLISIRVTLDGEQGVIRDRDVL